MRRRTASMSLKTKQKSPPKPRPAFWPTSATIASTVDLCAHPTPCGKEYRREAIERQWPIIRHALPASRAKGGRSLADTVF
jgi:hypothetical protein